MDSFIPNTEANEQAQPALSINDRYAQPLMSSEEIVHSECPSCFKNVSADDAFCDSCGFPLKGTEFEKQYFLNDRTYQQMNLEDLNTRIKSASTTLYVLGGLSAVVGMFFYAVPNDLGDPLALLITYMILAALYLGLAVWSKSQPLAALISGLVLFGILQVLAIIDDPSKILSGIIIKVIVIVYLVKGIQSASEAQRIKKELNL